MRKTRSCAFLHMTSSLSFLLFVHLHAWNYQIILNRYCCSSLRHKYEQAFEKLFRSFSLLCVCCLLENNSWWTIQKIFLWKIVCIMKFIPNFNATVQERRKWLSRKHVTASCEAFNFFLEAEIFSLVILVFGSLRRVFENRCQFSPPPRPEQTSSLTQFGNGFQEKRKRTKMLLTKEKRNVFKDILLHKSWFAYACGVDADFLVCSGFARN